MKIPLAAERKNNYILDPMWRGQAPLLVGGLLGQIEWLWEVWTPLMWSTCPLALSQDRERYALVVARLPVSTLPHIST